MANILFWKIEFVADSPFGTYVSGDVVELYMDEVTSYPLVYLNGVQIFSSGGSIFPGPSIELYKVETDFNPLVCGGTTLIIGERILFFPYMAIKFLPNHPSCPFDPGDPDPPIICDLIVTGIPVVTKATTLTSSDGALTVTAESTRAIQYKIGSDFVYADGTGQSSGTFTGLAHGNYRVFIRDAANCGTNILIGVPVQNVISDDSAYYVCEYDDYIGGRSKIVILKRDYEGEPIEVCGADDPFNLLLRGEGDNDKFTSVFSTQGNLNLTSTTDFQFGNIYTNDPDQFRMNYYKDYNDGNGYVLAWRGKVLPKQYQEEYKCPPYYVQITATDGLPSLQEIQLLKDDGTLYFGTIKKIELIAFCLKKTGIELPIRCAINLYATTMFQTDSDDPLDQAFVDFDAYYIEYRSPTLMDVLKHTLKPYGARLMQCEGYWNITRVEELRGAYDFREFDKDGVYVGNDNLNPLVSVNPPSISHNLNWSDCDQYLELRQGYGKIRVIYKLGLTDNFLRNGDFRLKPVFDESTQKYKLVVDTFGFQLVNGGETVNQGYEDLGNGNVAFLMEGPQLSTTDNGESYLISAPYSFKMGSTNTLKIIVRYKIPTPLDILFFPINQPYQKVRIVVKFGNLYLQSAGNWTATYNEITYYVTEFDKYIDAEITANQPNAAYASTAHDFTIRVFHSYAGHAEFDSYTDLKTKVTVNLAESSRTEVFDTPYNYYYTLQNNTDAESIPLIVRPNDYNATTNPYQWVWDGIQRLGRGGFMGSKSSHWLDKLQVQFLDNGALPIDTIIHENNAESNNLDILDTDLIHGSYTELVKTTIIFQNPNPLNIGPGLNVPISSFTPPLSSGVPIEIIQSVLAGNLIYRGYIRDSNDVGYQNWKRDGINESTTLHAILARSMASQYKRTHKKITGTLYGNTTYLKFINTLKEVLDDNRLYIPMSMTIYDKTNKYNGEFLELIDITEGAGSDGGGEAPFTSGFTTGFGAGYD